jgi:hypothetical protein
LVQLWPWYFWAIGVLLFLLVVVFEGAFAAVRKREDALERAAADAKLAKERAAEDARLAEERAARESERQQREIATLKGSQRPRLDVEYDGAHSDFSSSKRIEVYRLRVFSRGGDDVITIKGVRVRVTGIVPSPTVWIPGESMDISLRAMKIAGEEIPRPPFTLNKDAPLFVDFLEQTGRPEVRSSEAGTDGEHRSVTRIVQVMRLCSDLRPLSDGSKQHGLEIAFMEGVDYLIEVEVQGHDAITSRKIFRVRSLFPGHASDGAGLDITEVEP